jgi:hypothetical protein
MAAPLYARYIPPKAPIKVSKSSKELSIPQVELAREISPLDERAKTSENVTDKAEGNRPKKRKARDVDIEAESDVLETPSSRHEAIFAKFNKSARLSETLKKSNATTTLKNESNVQENEPSPELHGT